MDNRKDADVSFPRWLTSERLLTLSCSLLVVVAGSLIGVWLSRIDHTITRVDQHDARFALNESRLAIQEYDQKQSKERFIDLEKWKSEFDKRLREVENSSFRAK